jgi:phospholipid/cholesterol/gamma-HCH transport system permease protein
MVEPRLAQLVLAAGDWSLQTDQVQALDSAGALLLERTARRLRTSGVRLSLREVSPPHQALLALVRSEEMFAPAPAIPLNSVERLGRGALNMLEQAYNLLVFVGECAVQALPLLLRPHQIRWRQVVVETRRAGVTALPIIGLLSFLIGIVIAYQGGLPLQRYGANIFIIDLVAITILREMGPLITAIIVAGRTGSSYAAEIGTMQVTEEVDALRTIGITPFEMLVLPKLIALLVALPLLTVFADIIGLLGGMLAAQGLLGVGPQAFLERLPSQLPHSTFWVGIVKTPVFAAIITLAGCFHGFQVYGSAERVGRATTASVVLSIFLVIVADGLFSILFNLLNL